MRLAYAVAVPGYCTDLGHYLTYFRGTRKRRHAHIQLDASLPLCWQSSPLGPEVRFSVPSPICSYPSHLHPASSQSYKNVFTKWKEKQERVEIWMLWHMERNETNCPDKQITVTVLVRTLDWSLLSTRLCVEFLTGIVSLNSFNNSVGCVVLLSLFYSLF